MSRACPVAVRIRKHGEVWRVITRGGRYTEYATFEEAWKASIPYFAGLTR